MGMVPIYLLLALASGAALAQNCPPVDPAQQKASPTARR